MKRLYLIFALMMAGMAGMAGLASAPAMARGHGHASVGFYFGGPGYYGGYGGYGPGWGPGWGAGYYGGYGYPYYGPRYYYPPPVVYAPPSYAPYGEQAPATNYVEQAPAQAQRAPMPQQDDVTDNEGDTSWYYCSPQKKYYPYVKSCPTGWTRVPATPEDAR